MRWLKTARFKDLTSAEALLRCATTQCVSKPSNHAQAASKRSRQARPPELEDKMKLVTRFEAAAMNTNELKGLLRILFNKLAQSDAQSHEHRNALASLETVQRELVKRI